MKTLVVSMLRVGDLFQHMKMVQMFVHQEHLGEIHWLIDESSQNAQGLLNTRVHLFPRSTIQKIIVERMAHPKRAIRLVGDLIRSVNRENYDLVLNLTHTRVAHQLLDQIRAGEIRGGRKDIQTMSALKILNDVAANESDPPSVYAKLLSAGLGFDWKLPLPTIDAFPRRGLAFHFLSQDEKKNWNLENWKVVLQSLRQQFPNEYFYLLGAPYQAEELNRLRSPKVEIFCQDFSQTQKLLSNVRALIGIDSSLAHLAATVDTPSYLLYLGSANEKKIVPLQDDSFLLTAKSSCFPCPHSGKCHQSSHVCGESVTPSVVIEFLKQCFNAKKSVPAVGLGNIFAGL